MRGIGKKACWKAEGGEVAVNETVDGEAELGEAESGEAAGGGAEGPEADVGEAEIAILLSENCDSTDIPRKIL